MLVLHSFADPAAAITSCGVCYTTRVVSNHIVQTLCRCLIRVATVHLLLTSPPIASNILHAAPAAAITSRCLYTSLTFAHRLPATRLRFIRIKQRSRTIYTILKIASYEWPLESTFPLCLRIQILQTALPHCNRNHAQLRTHLHTLPNQTQHPIKPATVHILLEIHHLPTNSSITTYYFICITLQNIVYMTKGLTHVHTISPILHLELLLRSPLCRGDYILRHHLFTTTCSSLLVFSLCSSARLVSPSRAWFDTSPNGGGEQTRDSLT